MKDPRNTLVTVLGGGGFVGRYVCEHLFKAGVRVRVAQRNPKAAFFLQPLAGIGQLDVVRADITRKDSLVAAIAGSSAVINLVGTFKGDLYAAHAAGPKAAAEAAAKTGVQAFVHISAIGADLESPSDYGRTKGQGEAAVKAAFPKVTIIRPSLAFGPEDQLTNRFAALMGRLPVYPVIAPNTHFQPIYVRDLARAIAAAALDPKAHGGKTYELAGPEVVTMRELSEAIGRMASQAPMFIDVPDFAAEMISYLGFLPGMPLTHDQWLMLQKDNVAGPKSKGLAAFGITPTPMEAVAPDWLSRFRHGGRFAARRDTHAVG